MCISVGVKVSSASAIEAAMKYCVFFSNKTYLRNSSLLVLALTFALLSIAPSFLVKLCCRLNLCKSLSLGKKKKKDTFSAVNIRYSQSRVKHLHVRVYQVSSVQREATVLF